jgi:hypothetical protein
VERGTGLGTARGARTCRGRPNSERRRRDGARVTLPEPPGDGWVGLSFFAVFFSIQKIRMERLKLSLFGVINDVNLKEK